MRKWFAPTIANAEPHALNSAVAAAQKQLGLHVRPCQRHAAFLLTRGNIAEMQTGEGKTLTIALAAAQLATRFPKVLVATANDYLARRDAQWMSPIYDALGLRTASLTPNSRSQTTADAFQADVIYSTLRCFAFDYLRQLLAAHSSGSTTKAPVFPFEALIIDEADSILIDEARMPLIISSSTQRIDPAMEACYGWAAKVAHQFLVDIDFARNSVYGFVALTESGRHRLMSLAMPHEMRSLTSTEIQHALERALWINQSIHRDIHYLVKESAIHLVDEFTGRDSGQRSFGGGLHQAIQAREQVPLTPESQPAARTTVQDFVQRFRFVSGITATAWEDRHELRRVYRMPVQIVQPHRPSRRIDFDTQVASNRDDKESCIVADTRRMIEQHRPVLIGTRSIADSERLSRLLSEASIDHALLTAKNPEEEAQVVAKAGSLADDRRTGRVTIATNLAGRGTDIPLEADVAETGGLHVIVSQPHAAQRIDRQLRGRAGRQGDAGSSQLYCCPDDEILQHAFGEERVAELRRKALEAPASSSLVRQVELAQRIVAKHQRDQRARLLAHEASVTTSLQQLGLNPELAPLPNIH